MSTYRSAFLKVNFIILVILFNISNFRISDIKSTGVTNQRDTAAEIIPKFRNAQEKLCLDQLISMSRNKVDILSAFNFTKLIIPSNLSLNNIYPKLKLLIGVGSEKCGTTFFHNQFKGMLDSINSYKLNTNFVFTEFEGNYWVRCMSKCNFNDYLTIFIHKHSNYQNYYTQYKDFNHIVFTEKTPMYIRTYSVAYSLSHYARFYDTSFYLFLRNPIRRAWSAYWMYKARGRFPNLNVGKTFYHKNNTLYKIQSMSDKIERDIDTLPIEHPLYHKLLCMISSDETNEKDIVYVFIQASIVSEQNNKQSHPLDIVPIIIASCYYPQILTWYYMFQENNLNFETRFKIIQSEYMFANVKNSIKQLICWLLDDNECVKMDNLLDNERFSKLLTDKQKKNGIAPHGMDVMNLPIAQSLQNMYTHCNQKLYAFLQKHPEILMTNTSFGQWD